MRRDLDTKEMHTYYMSNNIGLVAAAKRFGITATSLAKRFKKANLPTKTRNQTREVAIDKDKLAQLYLINNLSIDELSNYFKCSRGTIWSNLCLLGINKSPEKAKSDRYDNYNLWTEEFTNKVKRVFEETKCIAETSKITGANEETIREKNKEWGIEVNFWNNKNTTKAKRLLEAHRDYDEVAKALGISKSSLACKNYRDWNIDLSDNSSLFGIPTVASDGNKYRSKLESYVADFLFANNIDYEYEKVVCDNRRWTCDFVVGDLWIEVDGLEDRRLATDGSTYSGNNEKIKHYKENGYRFIILNKANWKKQLKSALDLS